MPESTQCANITILYQETKLTFFSFLFQSEIGICGFQVLGQMNCVHTRELQWQKLTNSALHWSAKRWRST